MSFVLAEGTYTSYAVYDSFDDTSITDLERCGAFINCLEDKATLIIANGAVYLKVYDIDLKTLGSAVELDEAEFSGYDWLKTKFRQTLLNTYTVFVDKTTMDVLIYKNGALLQRTTLTSLGLYVGYYYSISISPRGKYIFIAGYRPATGHYGWVVLKGT